MKYLVTDPTSEHHGKTLAKEGNVYHQGNKTGVLLTLEDEIGRYSESFLFEQLIDAKKTEVLYFNQVLGLFDNYVRFEAGNDQNEDFTIEIELEEFALHLDCDTSKMYLLSEDEFLDAYDWCDSAKAIYDTWIKYGREGFDVTIAK